jgi:hypothetical protein
VRKFTKAEWEALPEEARKILGDMYVASGDSYVLKEDPSVETERTARTKAEEALRKAQEELTALADRRDIDPKKYKELMDAAAAAEQRQAEEQKDLEKLKQLAAEQATAPLLARIKELEGSVATLTTERTNLQTQLTDEVAFTDDTLIGDRLKGWTGQRVHPQLQAAFEALVRRDHQPFVKRDGKSRTPLFKKGDAEVAWDAFLKDVETAEWAKPFLLSETNGNGGGGSGAGGAGDSATKSGQGGGGAKKQVKASEMGSHLEAIANGEAVVVEG